MTDEEKKAIEILKDREYDFDELYCTFRQSFIKPYDKSIGIILNLIEKQSKKIERINEILIWKQKHEEQLQKEIEELKKHRQILNNVEFGKFPYDKNYQVKIEAGRQQGKSFRAGMEFSNKIWKDKIKATIEEKRKVLTDTNVIIIDVLESLLEKE